MQMLCVAAEANPIGYLTVGARPIGATDLAHLTGASEAEVCTLLGELEGNGVFSRDRKGCIYNRRMVRDSRIARRNQKNGKKGGNPRLLHPPDKPSETGAGLTNWITPKPEARSQKERESPIGDLSENGSCRLPDAAVEMTRIWNEECGSISRANKPNSTRQANCARRWQEEFGADAASWRAYCRRIAASPHLRGENDRGWRADFDWVIKPENLSRIMEGRYDPRSDNRITVNGKHPGTYRPGPAAALFEGSYNAAEEYIKRHGIYQADIGPDSPSAVPLLDGERTGGDAAGPDGGLARRPR